MPDMSLGPTENTGLTMEFESTVKCPEVCPVLTYLSIKEEEEEEEEEEEKK